MQTAKDIMTPNPLAFAMTTDVLTAVRELLARRINGAPVLAPDGRVVGVLTQADLVAQQKRLKVPSFFTLFDGIFPLASTSDMDKEIKKMAALSVGDAMTADPVTVGPDTGIEEIATIMAEKKLYTLPVVEHGTLVGVVGKEDVLKAAFPAPAAKGA
ncbi:MAG: CBS domain-containing protein [Desulfovibrionaceae bacterium]